MQFKQSKKMREPDDDRRERARPYRRRSDKAYDELDRRIVTVLGKDGRMSNIEVAHVLGVTEATVRKRVSRLIEEKLMKIVAVPDPVAFGMQTSAIIGISVQLDAFESVAQAFIALPETRYVGYSTGPYDLIIEAFFPSNEALLHFLSQKVSKIAGITRTETSIIMRVAKFAYEWEIPETTVVNNGSREESS